MITDHFDDGGYTGGNMDRPALKRLLAAVEARSVDCIVVYKVDRLSRSLLDFARIIEIFDRNGVSFVAVILCDEWTGQWGFTHCGIVRAWSLSAFSSGPSITPGLDQQHSVWRFCNRGQAVRAARSRPALSIPSAAQQSRHVNNAEGAGALKRQP